MKRYNRANKKFVLLGLVLPILVFFISYSVVFAYFTSTHKNNIDSYAAIVKIGFDGAEDASKVSHQIKTGSTTSSETTIMPGDTLVANATIVNEGNVDVYAIFNFVINITKTNGITETDVNDFYTFNSDGTVKKLIATNGVYTDEACLMTPNQKINVSVTMFFKGLFYGNEYKNAKVTYSITAHAIQTVNIGTAVNATNLLINNTNENYSNLQIFGNSIQSGTPTPETPIKVESVGERTKNLFGYDNLLKNDYINLTDVNSGEFYFIKSIGIPSTYIKAKENTVYIISYKVKVAIAQSISLAIYYTDGTYSNVSVINTVVGEYVEVSGTTKENKTIDYIKFGGGGGLSLNTFFKEIQIEEGNTATEYEPYGYKIPVKVSGKNLVNWSITPTRIDTDGTGTMRYGYKIPLSSGTYTVSGSHTERIDLYARTLIDDVYGDTKTIFNVSVLSGNKTLELTSDGYLLIWTSVGIDNWGNLKAQVEKNSEATGYEPYIEPIVTNIYLNEPLRKVGDYADYIDFATGTVVRNVKSIAFTGTENWALEHPESQTENAFLNIGLINGNFNCNIGMNDTNAESGENFAIKADNGNIRFYRPFETDIIETTASLENWKAWLAERYASGNPIIVEYATKAITVEKFDLPDILNYPIDNLTFGTTIQPSVINWK